MNKIIVIGDDHRNTLGLVRSLGEAGLRPTVFLDKKVSGMVEASKYVGECSYMPFGCAIEYIGGYKSPVVFVSCDKAIKVLDEHYDKLKSRALMFNAKGRISYYMDKGKQYDLASKFCIRCPNTTIVTTRNVDSVVINYPCLVKAANSTEAPKSEMKVVSSKEELISHIRGNINYLAQEYIKKDYEVLMNWCSLPNGEIIKGGIVRKIRQFPYNYGCSSYSVYEPQERYEGIIPFKALEEMVRKIGYVGLFSIEMIVKDDKAYLLEINLRNDGTGYIVTKSGLNLPNIWYRAVTGRDYEIGKQKTGFHSMIEEVDYKHIKGKTVGMLKWIRDLFRTKCFLVFNRKDIRPFLKCFRWKIKNNC